MFVDFRHVTVGAICPTLQAKNQGGYSLNYLPGVLTWVKAKNAQTSEDFETWEEREVGRTLNAYENADDSRATMLITYPMQEENVEVQTVLGDVAHTLTNEGHDASEDGTGGSMAGFAQEGDVSMTLTVGSGLNIASPPAVALPDLVVRRLTPIECERLQGLPDDHTRWKIDEKTGDTVEQSDSARYKQCGNGLAVPVMQWIVDGILALDAEEH